MHVMLLGDVLALAFCLFAAFAGIFVASFAAAMLSAPAHTMGGDESDLVSQLQETRARLARLSYEATYSRVMREAEAEEAAESVCGESAANVSAPAPALPPRGLVRPPTAEMRAAWASSLDAPDTGFPVVAGVMPTRVAAYSPFPPVEWEQEEIDSNFIGGYTFELPKSTRVFSVGVN